MKNVNVDSPSTNSSVPDPRSISPDQQVPLNVAIRKDYRPIQYRRSYENPQQSATDEGLKRARQQQHKAQLEKMNNQQR